MKRSVRTPIMNLKRLLSEPVILAFVALVDLASVTALIVCHRDVTNKEAQAAVEQQVHEAVSAKNSPASTEMVHYTPATINSLLHPADAKSQTDRSREIPALKNQ